MHSACYYFSTGGKFQPVSILCSYTLLLKLPVPTHSCYRFEVSISLLCDAVLLQSTDLIYCARSEWGCVQMLYCSLTCFSSSKTCSSTPSFRNSSFTFLMTSSTTSLYRLICEGVCVCVCEMCVKVTCHNHNLQVHISPKITLHYTTFPDTKKESTLWNARNFIILSLSATSRPFCWIYFYLLFTTSKTEYTHTLYKDSSSIANTTHTKQKPIGIAPVFQGYNVHFHPTSVHNSLSLNFFESQFRYHLQCMHIHT